MDSSRLVILGASAVPINTFVRGLNLYSVSLRFCLVETGELNTRFLNLKVLTFFFYFFFSAWKLLHSWRAFRKVKILLLSSGIKIKVNQGQTLLVKETSINNWRTMLLPSKIPFEVGGILTFWRLQCSFV